MKSDQKVFGCRDVYTLFKLLCDSNLICNSSNTDQPKMNNKNCVKASENGNEAYNTYLIENHVSSLSTNRKMQTNVQRSASSSHHAAYDSSSRASGSFINGDLIDLCDQAHDYEHLSGSNRDLVEAINSQLLAEIHGNSQSARDCNVLYPTKVSFDNTISGTKLNHMKKLNNSVDLSSSAAAAARSSEAISSKCSETTNEQHQTVIREFKRLGTYCTLRPEQRRKHLLKVLPNLRNSMLLQTLLGSNTGSRNVLKTHTADELPTANQDLDSLLVDLDDFIIDGNTTRMQSICNGQFNSSESFTSNCDSRSQISSNADGTASFAPSCYTVSGADEMSKSCIKIDPDKVEDCLLELDAYLEEIDRDYVLACAAHSPASSTPHNPTDCLNNNAKSTKISANLTNACSEKTSKNRIDCLLNMDNFVGCNGSGGSVIQSDHLIDDCIDDTQSIGAPNLRKLISNSDIQMDQCGKSNEAREINGSRNTDNKRKSNDIAYDQPLKRGHKLRNTVAVSGHNNQAIVSSFNDGAPSQSGKIKSFNFYGTFFSLRKCCPYQFGCKKQKKKKQKSVCV